MEGEGALEPKRASLKVASLSTLDATTPLWPASPLSPFRSSGAICSSLLAPASPAKQQCEPQNCMPQSEQQTQCKTLMAALHFAQSCLSRD